MSPTTTTAAAEDEITARSGRAPGARARIVDAALTLMSERGAAGTSMRRLADACGLNVATIYHYFPSKADLLRAVIEERRYGERLATDDPPIDAELPPGDRLAALLEWIWHQTEAEHTVLRLILGEGVRGDGTARRSARELITALDAGLTAWLAAGFPELADRCLEPATAARLVRRQLLALVAEQLAVGETDGSAAASELATTLFPPLSLR
jgi:AcrR family transcriptional regulator